MESLLAISHIADQSGCAFYRMRTPAMALQSRHQNLRVIESPKYIPIPQFYQDVRLVRLQRQVSTQQAEYFFKFLKPCSERHGFWLNYEIDDVIGKDDIPRYNTGWGAYQQPEFHKSISSIMQNCDFLTTTTKELADYYITKFGVKKENVLIIPNYLPKWWIDGIYDLDKITARYRNMKKPKIVFPASTTHYDVANVNGGVDDFTHIVDLVRSTTDKYDWTFVGGVPQQLNDLVADGKVKYIRGFEIFNYPKEIAKLGFDLAVAPLQDNVFNRKKSEIKFSEFSAMGIPVICQDLVTYKDYTNLLFKDGNSLQNQIDSILSTEEKYLDAVKHYRNCIEFGDKNRHNGYFLEDNLEEWHKLFFINQRTLRFDLRNAIDKKKNPSVTENTELTFEK